MPGTTRYTLGDPLTYSQLKPYPWYGLAFYCMVCGAIVCILTVCDTGIKIHTYEKLLITKIYFEKY